MLQNQVSVVVSLMRLRDWFMMQVFLVTIFKFIFVSLSSSIKDFCSFVQQIVSPATSNFVLFI